MKKYQSTKLLKQNTLHFSSNRPSSVSSQLKNSNSNIKDNKNIQEKYNETKYKQAQRCLLKLQDERKSSQQQDKKQIMKFINKIEEKKRNNFKNSINVKESIYPQEKKSCQNQKRVLERQSKQKKEKKKNSIKYNTKEVIHHPQKLQLQSKRVISLLKVPIILKNIEKNCQILKKIHAQQHQKTICMKNQSNQKRYLSGQESKQNMFSASNMKYSQNNQNHMNKNHPQENNSMNKSVDPNLNHHNKHNKHNQQRILKDESRIASLLENKNTKKITCQSKKSKDQKIEKIEKIKNDKNKINISDSKYSNIDAKVLAFYNDYRQKIDHNQLNRSNIKKNKGKKIEIEQLNINLSKKKLIVQQIEENSKFLKNNQLRHSFQQKNSITKSLFSTLQPQKNRENHERKQNKGQQNEKKSLIDKFNDQLPCEKKEQFVIFEQYEPNFNKDQSYKKQMSERMKKKQIFEQSKYYVKEVPKKKAQKICIIADIVEYSLQKKSLKKEENNNMNEVENGRLEGDRRVNESELNTEGLANEDSLMGCDITLVEEGHIIDEDCYLFTLEL